MARGNYTFCDGDQHPLAVNSEHPQCLMRRLMSSLLLTWPGAGLFSQSSLARNLRVIIGDPGETFHSSPDIKFNPLFCKIENPYPNKNLLAKGNSKPEDILPLDSTNSNTKMHTKTMHRCITCALRSSLEGNFMYVFIWPKDILHQE